MSPVACPQVLIKLVHLLWISSSWIGSSLRSQVDGTIVVAAEDVVNDGFGRKVQDALARNSFSWNREWKNEDEESVDQTKKKESKIECNKKQFNFGVLAF